MLTTITITAMAPIAADDGRSSCALVYFRRVLDTSSASTVRSANRSSNVSVLLLALTEIVPLLLLQAQYSVPLKLMDMFGKMVYRVVLGNTGGVEVVVGEGVVVIVDVEVEDVYVV